ncbi:MAG: RHS repeat-associated core domain-containing protein, partial [Planctomycetaceae bacterium]|nr:RHS repeat-associated core domain-containing protein [Planctomycetaceae bacterium]
TLDSTGKLQSRYLWGTKQDELICNNDNWTLNDHLNTIRDIVKSDGNVEFHLEYNAFGKLISETKNDQLLFAYTGKLTDKSSDLQWNINRWYDSNAGRWVNEDPIMFEGKTFNLYDYVANNPMYYIDSWGLVKKTYGPFKPKDRSEKKRINLIQSLLHNAFVDVTYGYKDFVISVTEESVCCKKTLWSPEMYGYKYDFIVSGKISVEALGEIEKRKGIDLILVGASIYAKVGIKGSANLLIDKLQFSYSTCDSVANSHLQSSYKLDINVYAIVGANMKYLNNEIAAIAKISGTVTYSGNLSMTGSFDFPTKKASVRFSTDGLKKQNIQSEIKANLSFNYNDKEYIKELVLL